MGDRLEFTVLGPLEVRSGTGPVPISGQRQRTVLAMLLLSPGRVVSVDSLVEAVWDDRPPATGRTQIAICVAGLRKAFKAAGCADDVILTRAPGYLLLPEAHSIDASEFERELDQAQRLEQGGRHAESVRCYAAALGRWNGPALSGVTGRFAESAAARLEELRLTAYEQSAALRLAEGEHRELIGELTGLLRQHPLREQVRAHLMLAQYRSGRRAEALETFREGRALLIDELGLEPGKVLRELHAAILADDPVLTPVAAVGAPVRVKAGVVPAQLPPSTARFTGRTVELSTLDDVLSVRGSASMPSVGYVTGMPGVGKTELALRWAHRAADRFPDGQLFVDLCGYDRDRAPLSSMEVLAGFLRAFGVPDGELPVELGERAALYRSLLAGKRVLVVLDNAASYAQVRPLLPGNRECCVVVTGRDQLPELVGGPGSARIRLSPFGASESVEFVRRALPVLEREDAAGLAELCDGLPLALSAATTRLLAKPHWSATRLVRMLTDERRRLDELSCDERGGLRAAFESSYLRLSPEAARLYRGLGTLDVPHVAAWVGAALLDCTVPEAEKWLEELLDASMLDVRLSDVDGSVRYRLEPLPRIFARECALLQESPVERSAATERAFGAWMDLASAAAELAEGTATVATDALGRWLAREEIAALAENPLEWLEIERDAVLAVVHQATGMGLVLYAWNLATCAQKLDRDLTAVFSELAS
ncbi:AfsR/SARP family transcriptional regulator [Allokutzneria albata]|uniref:DNA-binding transcriptional activator of the SARP family n=1 Tax=Allokutzneria albata TaxID=211114 RepID=A0A1G9RN49_ALLAB|nr:AfsR/SARP family transcriptional regulator [Allokutzneria albata]SDM24698.1 DNA-binding transcriptional activator of the SARP family [Allokutzneria albata]